MKKSKVQEFRTTLGEALLTPVEEPKVHVEDKTVISFTDLDSWKKAAEDRGLLVNSERGDDGEHFAEEEDITMIGYFNDKDDWGMLV